MKKLILILFLFISYLSFSQASLTKSVRIQNATTAFGRNISVGTIVYDINTDNVYMATSAITSTSTITTASASLNEIANFSDITGINSGTNTGDQTITNTSDATSHTATLSASGGSLQLIEGTNITLTTGGTGTDGTVTIASTGGASPLTTKGDLYTYSTVDARLPIGTNGQVLKANSAQTTGLEWSTLTATSTANTNTTIDLSNPFGNFCNMSSANANTSFTTTGAVTGGTARVKINTTSQPTVTGATLDGGSGWIANTDLYMTVYYDGATTRYYFTSTFPKTPTLSKSITIPDPVATDDITLFYTPVAITITGVYSHIEGTTNVVFNVGHAATRTGTQLDVFTSDITLTSTAGQSNTTGFNDATIPANSWVWLEAVSVSGTPTLFHGTIVYTED